MIHSKTNSVNLNLSAEEKNIRKTASETFHRRLLAILYLKKIFLMIFTFLLNEILIIFPLKVSLLKAPDGLTKTKPMSLLEKNFVGV